VIERGQILSLWGKAHPAEGAPPFHPLLAHCLDVAAVAARLAPRHPPGIAPRTVAFLTALHDIGKISPGFQAKVPPLWPAAFGAPPDPVPADPGHDSTGFALLREPEPAEALAAVFPGWSDGHRRPLLAAIAGHHGRPPREEFTNRRGLIGGPCRQIAVDFITLLAALLAPEPLARPADARGRAVLGWQLAGLMTLADWIGSAQHWFPYVAPHALADPADYYTCALEQASRAVAEAGVGGARPAPFRGLGGLFPAIARPTALQEWAATATLPEGPCLFIVEEATGGGQDGSGADAGTAADGGRPRRRTLPRVANDGDGKRHVRAAGGGVSAPVRARPGTLVGARARAGGAAPGLCGGDFGASCRRGIRGAWRGL
jgi:CRISPR-associated endonuclease/helicase Cas3